MVRKGNRGPTPERLAQAAQVAELRGQGLLQREIAVRLGMSRGKVSELLTDPDGSRARARKDGYALPCPECGQPMSGADGRGAAPSRCADCAESLAHANRYWRPETIVEAFREFHRQTGRAPTTGDRLGYNPSFQDRMSPERHREYERIAEAAARLPTPTTVKKEFPGGWTEALDAAGFPPSRLGGQSHRGYRPRQTGRQAILAVLHEGAATPREVAERIWVARATAAAALYVLYRDGLVVRDLHHPGPGHRGGYTYLYRINPDRKDNPMPRLFVVLAVRPDGSWTEISREDAPTGDIAIERAAKDPGTYVAVPEHQWVPVPVEPTTALRVVRPPAGT